MEFEGYCVKCREKRTVSNGEVKTSPNGRQMAQGKCPVCGTTITRFMASSGAGASKSDGGQAKAASGSKESKGSKSSASTGGKSSSAGKAGANTPAATGTKSRSGKSGK